MNLRKLACYSYNLHAIARGGFDLTFPELQRENGDFMVLKVLTATENGDYRRGAEGGKFFLGLF